jgi:hypothetical protein
MTRYGFFNLLFLACKAICLLHSCRLTQHELLSQIRINAFIVYINDMDSARLFHKNLQNTDPPLRFFSKKPLLYQVFDAEKGSASAFSLTFISLRLINEITQHDRNSIRKEIL